MLVHMTEKVEIEATGGGDFGVPLSPARRGQPIGGLVGDEEIRTMLSAPCRRVATGRTNYLPRIDV